MLHSRASQILVFTSSHFEINDASTSDSEMVKDLRYGIFMAFSFLFKDKGPLFTSKLTNAQIITFLEN